MIDYFVKIFNKPIIAWSLTEKFALVGLFLLMILAICLISGFVVGIIKVFKKIKKKNKKI